VEERGGERDSGGRANLIGTVGLRKVKDSNNGELNGR